MNLEAARKALEELHPDMPEAEYFALWQDLRLSALEFATRSINDMSHEEYERFTIEAIEAHLDLWNIINKRSK